MKYQFLIPLSLEDMQKVIAIHEEGEEPVRIGTTFFHTQTVDDVCYVFTDKRKFYKLIIEERDISITELTKSVDVSRQMLNWVLLSKRTLQKELEQKLDSILGLK